MKLDQALLCGLLALGVGASHLAAQTAGCGENPPSTGNKTLSNGKTYYLDIPSGYDEDSPIPALYAFHGTDPGNLPFGLETSGQLFCGTTFGIRLYGAFRDSDAVGNDAVLVCPDSETGLSEGGSFADWSMADFDLLRAEIESDLCIDVERRFATGHSAGASFVNELGCQRGAVFRAIAPVAPVFSAPSCSSPSGQVAAMILEGADDGFSQGPQSRNFWAGQNGCNTDSPIAISPSTCARDGSDTHETYAGCDAGYPVEYCEWDGLDHFGPWYFAGFLPGEDVAAPAVWAFFESLGSVLSGADLSISKNDGLTSVAPGGTVTYTIEARNLGPEAVTDAAVSDTFPAALTGCTYTSSASSGASGNTASGSGNISDTLSLDSGASVTYTVECTVQATATGTLSNTASISSAAVSDPVSGNDSATDNNTQVVSANLGITKTDNVTFADPLGTVTYAIVASNAGPSAAGDALVSDTFPAQLTGCSWTSVAAGGASGNQNPGSGNLSDTVSLPAGGTVTYAVNCTVQASATGTLSNTASIASPTVADPVPGNNSATDGNTVIRRANLQITKTDGVTFALPGSEVVYTIVASNAGPTTVTDAVVADTFSSDLQSCTWTSQAAGGASGNAASGSGAINDTITLPAGGSVTYTATCTVASGATGALSNTATIDSAQIYDPNEANNTATDDDTSVGRDLGDAPDSGYPTLLASGGAFHGLTGVLYLGLGVDGEADGQPTAAADGDDANGDDEDGVAFTSSLGLGPTDTTATVDVTASAAGVLNAWIDFDGDQAWDGVGEQVLIDESVSGGLNELEITVPSTAVLGCTYSRFRLSSASGLAYGGEAPDGEVEDYAIPIVPADFYDIINTTFVDALTILALDTIAAGGEFSSPFPDVVVSGGADVTFHAENSIVLRNGFSVDEEGVFSAALGSVPTASCP